MAAAIPQLPGGFKRVALVLLFPILLAAGLVFGLSGQASRFLPPCLFHKWTGLHCPGCGGTRAFKALAHFDPLEALRMNPLATLFIATVAVLALRISWEAAFPRLRWWRPKLDPRTAWVLIGGLFLFALLRNLPWWPFTLLAPAGG